MTNYRKGVFIDPINYFTLHTSTVVLAEYDGAEWVGSILTLDQIMPVFDREKVKLYAVDVMAVLRQEYKKHEPTERDIAFEKKWTGQSLTTKEKSLVKELDNLWDTGVNND